MVDSPARTEGPCQYPCICHCEDVADWLTLYVALISYINILSLRIADSCFHITKPYLMLLAYNYLTHNLFQLSNSLNIDGTQQSTSKNLEYAKCATLSPRLHLRLIKFLASKAAHVFNSVRFEPSSHLHFHLCILALGILRDTWTQHTASLRTPAVCRKLHVYIPRSTGNHFCYMTPHSALTSMQKLSVMFSIF